MKKILFFVTGMALLLVVLRSLKKLFFGNDHFDKDTTLYLNPSPPARPGAWEISSD